MFLCTIGCPTILRCDKGTKNSTLAACHMALRHAHSDALSGEKSFRYGPSTSNTVSFWLQCVYSYYKHPSPMESFTRTYSFPYSSCIGRMSSATFYLMSSSELSNSMFWRRHTPSRPVATMHVHTSSSLTGQYHATK